MAEFRRDGSGGVQDIAAARTSTEHCIAGTATTGASCVPGISGDESTQAMANRGSSNSAGRRRGMDLLMWGIWMLNRGEVRGSQNLWIRFATCNRGSGLRSKDSNSIPHDNRR
jgi:hypothetical protein